MPKKPKKKIERDVPNPDTVMIGGPSHFSNLWKTYNFAQQRLNAEFGPYSGDHPIKRLGEKPLRKRGEIKRLGD